jgi:hypothetical protein
MAHYKSITYHVDYDAFKPETYRGVFAIADGKEVDRIAVPTEMEADYAKLERSLRGTADAYSDDDSVTNFRIDRDTRPGERGFNLKRKF